MLKTREDEGQEKKKKKNREKLEGGESGGRDGAPDLTTLTHSGPSLLASCALRLIPRGHAHTYIYLSTHAGDENILGPSARVCVFECALKCDSLSMRAKERVDATQKSYGQRLFPLAAAVPLFFVSSPTCVHICVCTGMFARVLGCAGAHFRLFLAARRREWAGYSVSQSKFMYVAPRNNQKVFKMLNIYIVTIE